MGLSVESRLEFCRKEGFKKLFELLMDQNETIAKEVLKTMRYFLEAGSHIETPDIDTGIKTKIKNVIYSAAQIAFKLFPSDNPEMPL
mmetsp:Transcript_23698/g.3934  ORF Transcript_23698/g.3934 Transcript_23698/m.3934 type:complete len:87 (+) Transcript_23698:477-737(+)